MLNEFEKFAKMKVLNKLKKKLNYRKNEKKNVKLHKNSKDLYEVKNLIKINNWKN